MIVTSTDFVPNMRVTQIIGIVRGNTIRARHLGRDIMAVFRHIVGGEISDYTKMLGESRDQALDRMEEHGRSVGADAILNVRFTTSAVMQGASELLAYGTAVKLSPEDN